MNIVATGMEWVEHIPGGLNRYFADYLKAMTELGHSVEGLLSGEGQKLEAPPYIRDVIQSPASLDTYKRMKSFYSAVKERTAWLKPDVFNPHFALYASMVTRNVIPQHVPIVTHFHGPWAHESQVEDQGGWLQKTIRYQVKKKVEQTIYRRSDEFIVLSQYFRDILSHDFGISQERIHVIPGAVDTATFQPAHDRIALRRELGIPEGTNVLFCARRLVRRMGIDHLIRAMAAVTRNVPGTALFIAGGGPLQGELEQLIGELELQDQVRLLGRVSAEDLVRWYQAADYSIVPTITLEGFGLVTTEALACGTPVLGTPYGGTREILERLSPACLFEDGSPEAMAAKLISVLQGGCTIPTRRDCREYILRHYTWERVSQSVTQVFEQAIAMRKEPMRNESSLL